jgi:hypothetical protein
LGVIGYSEPLRPEQGVDQVHKEEKRSNTRNHVVHIGETSLEAVARSSKSPAGHEEQSGYDDEEKVQHNFSLGFIR